MREKRRVLQEFENVFISKSAAFIGLSDGYVRSLLLLGGDVIQPFSEARAFLGGCARGKWKSLRSRRSFLW